MNFARKFTLITCLFKLASIEHAWLRHCYYFRWQSFLYSAPIVDLSEEFLTAITSLMEPPRRDAGRLLPKSLIQDCSSGSWALRRRRRNFSQILVTFLRSLVELPRSFLHSHRFLDCRMFLCSIYDF